MARLGYAAISLAAVLWAMGGATASYLADRGASVVELTEARAWISVVGIGAFLLVRNRRRGQPLRSVGWLIVPFGLAVAAANISYYLSVASLPVAVAIVIQYTAPGLVVAWMAIVDRTMPRPRTIGALVLALIGVAALSEIHLIQSAGLRLDRSGLAMAIVAALSFAAYLVLAERVGRALGAERAVFWGFVVAGVFWAVVQSVRGRPDTLLDPAFVPWALFLGVASTIAPFLLFVWGLEHVAVSRAAIVSTLEPVTAALIALVWLGQRLSLVQLVGGAMVVAGIVVVQTEREPDADVMAGRAAVE